ncbi:hypothetical protein [uncultured Sphingomonas sp.]|uniref:hypothetical protein n=1 Tax=uncultured Sphingomonas sp. TaxID=158754 RepID=UPI002623847C|nr:hypothetical protein [uncultured Sphingomonas sp.]
MRILPLLIAGTTLAVAAPTIAQNMPAPDLDAPHTPLPYDRGYDKDSARTEAIDAAGRPGVVAANRAALAESSAQTAVQQVDAAQYAADIQVYRQARRARHRQIARNDARYARQERAYADAMTDWRRQVAACDHGNTAACNAPTPDPARY